MTTVRASLAGDLRALFGARLKAVGHACGLALRESRFRVLALVATGALFWFGLFYFFYRGFVFINAFPEFKAVVLGYLFGLFFITLMALLVFSNAVIAYLGLFRSRETEFLMANPVPATTVFAYKFVESLVFSSWAFVLLGTPLLLAYGLTSRVPWYYYVSFFLYFPPFVVIPAAVGAVISLFLAAYLPRTRVGWLVAGSVTAALVTVGVLAAHGWPRGRGFLFSAEWLRFLTVRLEFTREPLLPSHWITEGVMAAAGGDLPRVVFYFLVLLSNALFVGLVALWIGGRVYPRGWARAQSGRRRRRRVARGWLAALVHRALFFVPAPSRLLLIKDLRTFRRDPAQWSQFIVFFGILGAYIGNLRTLAYDLKAEQFRAMVSLLNLSVVAMVVATFACRFVFPLMSLEGQNFWLLGLAPIQRRWVLIGKFVFAASGAVVMSVGLVVTSDLLLRSPLRVVLLDVLAMVLMSVGISGISVGLGARLPNLEEDNPSKIAAGFGGTLDLIVSLFYIASVVALMALPAHLQFAGRLVPGAGLASLAMWLVLAAVGVTAVAVVVPLTLGIRHFRKMEF